MIDKRTEDIELKANSEADLLAGLPSEMFIDGELIKFNHEWAIDWGIPIETTPAVVDGEGTVITPAVMSDKFHANLRLLRGKVITIGAQFKINSATPSRKWA